MSQRNTGEKVHECAIAPDGVARILSKVNTELFSTCFVF